MGPASSTFLAALVEDTSLSEAQHHAVRKALYRLRQKGIEMQSTTEVQAGIRELFAVAENRIARWQPILYFRAHSSFSDAGDLYVLQLEESKNFEIAEQQRDLLIDAKAMSEMAEKYSANMEKHSGLKIPMRQMPSETGRYFLHRSLALLKDTTGERELSNFLRFIGPDESVNPGLVFETYEGYKPGPEQASSILESPFFAYWMFTTEETAEFVKELAELEKGPIVLPPAQVAERKHDAVIDWLKSYFNSKNRAVWALAFEKASYFLRESDFSQAQSAWVLSQALADSEIPVETIPATNFLLDRSLRIAAEDRDSREKEEKKGSLIVSPQEYMSRQGRR